MSPPDMFLRTSFIGLFQPDIFRCLFKDLEHFPLLVNGLENQTDDGDAAMQITYFDTTITANGGGAGIEAEAGRKCEIADGRCPREHVSVSHTVTPSLPIVQSGLQTFGRQK